jgi:hypothetical protein
VIGTKDIIDVNNKNIQVIPVLKYHVMKTYGGVDVIFHALLISTLEGG